MNTPTSAATFSADFSFTGVTGVIFFDPVPGAISDEVFATHTSTSVLVTSLQHGLDNAVFSPRGTADLRVVDGIVVNADLGSQYVDGPELYGLSLFAPPTGTVARLSGFLTVRSDGGSAQFLETGAPTFGTPIVVVEVDNGNGSGNSSGSGNGNGSGSGSGSSNGSASNGSGAVDDLTPIPLPASLPLLLGSLAGLVWLRSRPTWLRQRPSAPRLA